MFNKIISTYKAAFSGLSKESWMLSLVMLINRMGTMAAVFMSVYVTRIFGRSLADAGLVITLFGVGAVFGALSSGYFIKKAGFRSVQIVTSILSGLLFIFFAKITDFEMLCLVAVLIGFFSEAFRPANFTAIAYYSKPEMMTKSYSLNRFAVNLGMGLGTAVGGILASIDYHLLFFVEGGTYILVGILIMLLLPKISNFKKNRENLQISASKSPWKDVLYLKFLLLILIYISCFLVVFKLVPVFWKDIQHLDESLIGSILGLNGMIIAVFEMVLVQHLQTRNKDVVYIYAGIFIAAIAFSLILFPIFSVIVSAVIAIIFLTFSEMLALPFINTFVVNRAGAASRASYASAYTFVWSLSGIIAPAGGAFIADHFSYTTLWVVLIVLCLISALGIKMLSQREKSAF
ncbi:MFS transporter [Kaistella faecalis]|uniref:MFS transporter n=1 Tax=Kaistella faecalis TaxID=2852098 RepID=UPI001C48F905|nr:MFS transporter [Chryseobacterium faecale]UFK98427.1 MFS transporter [Chryseobacterium faecale]